MMADDVDADIVNALNTLSSTMERSGNMKRELKNTIYETVSTLRKLFAIVKDIDDSKSKEISELETLVATTKAELDEATSKTQKGQGMPPSNTRREQRTQAERGVAPSGGEQAKHYTYGREQSKLYSEALGGNLRHDTYKLTITPKDSLSPDKVKGIVKAKINPTKIKVEIKSIKALKTGRVQIETGSKDEIEILTKDINEKCGQILEVQVHRLRNPRLVIYNIPDDISTNNVEETLLSQNPELNLTVGDINPKFLYETKRRIRNLVIEVSAQTRKQMIHKKIKIGWLICNLEDYLVPKRCFQCSRYNHGSRECRGTETCPHCPGSHKMKECSAQPKDYKCINCQIFNTHNKNVKISENHSSMDKTCPSYRAIVNKYKQNTDY
jgi:hypothetical protein